MNENEPRIPLSVEMIKQSKNLTCDCGGILFREGVIIKKISQFISPTGKEERFPLEVLICENCGKVPSELNVQKLLPEEVIAKKIELDKIDLGKEF